MSDPYKVLGISRDATDEEIKKAYRTLSRKYHPDANIDNPHKDEAEKMFKIVQQAYEQILDERERGYSSPGGAGAGQRDPWGFGGYGSTGSYGGTGSYGSTGSYGGTGGYGGVEGSARRYGPDLSEPRMRAAANYINTRHFREAMHVLDDITPRTGTWHYLRALAHAGLGSNVTAVEEARQAAQMEPANYEFQRLCQQLGGSGEWYDTMGRGYGYGGSPCVPAAGGTGTSQAGCCTALALCNCCLFPYTGFCCC